MKEWPASRVPLSATASRAPDILLDPVQSRKVRYQHPEESMTATPSLRARVLSSLERAQRRPRTILLAGGNLARQAPKPLLTA